MAATAAGVAATADVAAAGMAAAGMAAAEAAAVVAVAGVTAAEAGLAAAARRVVKSSSDPSPSSLPRGRRVTLTTVPIQLAFDLSCGTKVNKSVM